MILVLVDLPFLIVEEVAIIFEHLDHSSAACGTPAEQIRGGQSSRIMTEGSSSGLLSCPRDEREVGLFTDHHPYEHSHTESLAQLYHSGSAAKWRRKQGDYTSSTKGLAAIRERKMEEVHGVR